VFRDRGCLNCHLIDRIGGRRGPDLTYIGDTLSQSDIVIRIVNGGVNMPAFGNTLKPDELNALVAFLQSRKRPLPGQNPSAKNDGSGGVYKKKAPLRMQIGPREPPLQQQSM